MVESTSAAAWFQAAEAALRAALEEKERSVLRLQADVESLRADGEAALTSALADKEAALGDQAALFAADMDRLAAQLGVASETSESLREELMACHARMQQAEQQSAGEQCVWLLGRFSVFSLSL